MKRSCCIIFICLTMVTSRGQENDILQIMEDQAGEDGNTEVEEDLQQWQIMLRHPLNLNTVGAEEFSIFHFISPVQVQRLIIYRSALGPLQNILELQAVPGWEAAQIRRIAPYVTVATEDQWSRLIKEGITEGKQQILTRMSMRNNNGGQFLGSAPSFLLRYQFRSKPMQFAINYEKDIGEQFVQPGKGLAFVSFHMAIPGRKNPRNIIVLGDFLVNMGQGLMHWQGRAIRKTGMPIIVKRQAPFIQPYRSNDENRFHRGIAVVRNKGSWTAMIFYSDKKIDGNQKFDSISKSYSISSLLTSGNHRNQTELDDKHRVRLISSGGVLVYEKNRLRLRVNAIHHFLSLPLVKDPDPYQKYAFRGQHLANYSLDYHYTIRNFHFFGETAVNDRFHSATLNGLMFSADPRLDLSFLMRKISPAFYSLQGNAFTESSEPSNETGFYTGISMRLSPTLILDGYADLYSFPWLKFNIDRPGWGKDILLQTTWKPDKKTTLYVRFRKEIKTENQGSLNIPALNIILPDSDDPNLRERMISVGEATRVNWRIHLSHIFSREFEWRLRVETSRVLFNQRVSQGYLFFSDIFWRPQQRGTAINTRVMFYESTDYSSRIYAFENDVMYYSSIPSFYGRGVLVYTNARLSMAKHWQFFVKGTLHTKQSLIGLQWAVRSELIYSW